MASSIKGRTLFSFISGETCVHTRSLPDQIGGHQLLSLSPAGGVNLMGDVINLFFVCVCSWWPPVLRVIVWARISLFGPLVELCVCVLYFLGFFFLFWLYFDFHLFCFSFDRIWGSRMSFTRKPSSSASTNCVNAQPAKSRNYWLWRPTLMATATRAVTPASLLLTAWSSPVSSRWNVVTSATSFCADSCTKDSSVTVSLICQLIGKQRRTSKSWPNFIFYFFSEIF